METETESLGQEHDNIVEAYKHKTEELHVVSENYRQATTKDENDHERLRQELEKIQTEFENKLQELDEIQEKLIAAKKTSPNVKNLKLQAKQSKQTITKQKTEIKSNSDRIESLENETEGKSSELIAAKQELKSVKAEPQEYERKMEEMKTEQIKLQKRVSYLNKKCHVKDNKITSLEDENINKMCSLEEKIGELQDENNELEKLLTLAEDPEIQTLCGSQYSDTVREVVMDLISFNVSPRQIDVIRTVLRKFANKDVFSLPSMGLKSRLALEGRHIADYQVGLNMLKGGDQAKLVGNCLHADGDYQV